MMPAADDRRAARLRVQALLALSATGWLGLAGPAACAPAAAAGHRRSVADVPVRAQDGRRLRFYSDLIRGRIAAVNFIFTGCSTVCSMMGAHFAGVQRLLGRQAAQVQLVSVSLDPLNDGPEQLLAWSRRFGAAPGWTLVTGGLPEMGELWASLGAAATDPAAHAPLAIVIDDLHGGPWQRLDGLADPATLAALLRSRLEGPRGASR
jgi:protein SCO1/2